MSKHSKKIKQIKRELLIESLQEDKDFFIREWKSLDEEATGQKRPMGEISN